MSDVRVEITEVREQIAKIFEGVGVPAEDALVAADGLIDAEVSGVKSHGMMRLSSYTDRILKGNINPKPQMKIEENGAVATLDGDNGLGQVVTGKATELAVSMAKKYGVGVVAVKGSNHFGTAGYYVRKMAEEGCIGFAASLAGPTVAPFGGMDLLMGTNPFAIGFPAKEEVFCADMATSAVAKGKIRVYAAKGESIPQGWALDAEGNDTTDPQKAIDGILLPMSGHKGYALAMAVDAICGLLSGAALSGESSSMFNTSKPANTGHCIIAIDIAHFLSLADFEERAQDWFDKLKASRKRPGFSRICIPGEPEAENRRNADGYMSIAEKSAETLREYTEKYAS